MGFVKKAIATLLIPASIFVFSAYRYAQVYDKLEDFDKNWMRDNLNYVIELATESYPLSRAFQRPELILSFFGNRDLNCKAVKRLAPFALGDEREARIDLYERDEINKIVQSNKYVKEKVTSALVKGIKGKTKTADVCREQIIYALGQIAYPEAREVLLEDLKSGSPNYYTPIALAIIGNRRAVPYLIEMLYSENEDNVYRAFYALAHLGDERVTPHLFKTLTSGTGRGKFGIRDDSAIKAFARMNGSEQYVNYALRLLRKSYWNNREWIELVLERGSNTQKRRLGEVLIRNWHPLDNYTTLLAGPVRNDQMMTYVASDMLR